MIAEYTLSNLFKRFSVKLKVNHSTNSQQPPRSHPNFELYPGAAQQQNLPISDWKLQVMRLYYQEKLRESSVREFEQMLNKFN